MSLSSFYWFPTSRQEVVSFYVGASSVLKFDTTKQTTSIQPQSVLSLTIELSSTDDLSFFIKSSDLLKGSVVQPATSCLNMNIRTLEFTDQTWAHLWR